jgi:hypothetical protein
MKKNISLAFIMLICNLSLSQVVDNKNLIKQDSLSEQIISKISNEVNNQKFESTHKDGIDKLEYEVGGYLETFYSHNFNNPSNNINALRGFDYIANSLTVSNFVIGVDAKYKNFSTRLAINIGTSPAQFYKQEPTTSGSYMIPKLSSSTWQYIQEAFVSYKFEKNPNITAQMGIFATPIGIEGLPTFQTWENSEKNHNMHKKDYRENWNFSRSNSFIHLPDYHSGIRLLYNLNEKNTFSFYVINGQNMITDNNKDKSIAFSYLWTPNQDFHFSAVYMGGNERATASPEGKAFRHIFDFHTRFNITNKIAFMNQLVPGFETTNFGNNSFLINATYLKYKINTNSNIAFRYEFLFEKLAAGSGPNFLKSFDEKNKATLHGFTTTFSRILVKDHLMIRLEYRHDYGTQNWFYKGQLQPSGNTNYPFLTNHNNQNTLSFSVVGWF